MFSNRTNIYVQLVLLLLLNLCQRTTFLFKLEFIISIVLTSRVELNIFSSLNTSSSNFELNQPKHSLFISSQNIFSNTKLINTSLNRIIPNVKYLRTSLTCLHPYLKWSAYLILNLFAYELRVWFHWGSAKLFVFKFGSTGTRRKPWFFWDSCGGWNWDSLWVWFHWNSSVLGL